MKCDSAVSAAAAVEGLCGYLGVRELQPRVAFPNEDAAVQAALEALGEAQENGARLRIEAAEACGAITSSARCCWWFR